MLLLVACGLTASDSGTCATFARDVEAAYAEAAACDTASDCGQPVAGTGCTEECDRVARTDADLTTLQQTIRGSVDAGCGLGLEPRCDCPPTVGFRCVSGLCDWDYGDFNQR